MHPAHKFPVSDKQFIEFIQENATEFTICSYDDICTSHTNIKVRNTTTCKVRLGLNLHCLYKNESLKICKIAHIWSFPKLEHANQLPSTWIDSMPLCCTCINGRQGS